MAEKSWGDLYSKWGRRQDTSSENMNLVEKIKKVLTDPEGFFRSIKSEKGLKGPFKYFAILSLVSLLINILTVLLDLSFMTSYSYLGKSGIGGAIGSYVSSLIFIFIGVGILHLIVKIFGGKGDYSDTFKAAVYGGTAANLLGWFPYIGILFGLYSFYLMVKGISSLHNISVIRALIIVLLPIVVLFIILAVLMLIIGIAFIGLILPFLGNTSVPV